MDPEYSQKYRQLYEQHWWFRAREDAIVEVLRRKQPPRGWGAILDVGCGDALFFDRLLQFGEVEGVEPDGAVVSPGPYRERIHVRPFDETFQPGKQYSLILMLDVLEHLAEPARALRHALTLLTPSGTVIATVPAFPSLWTNQDVINHHFRRYTRRSFRQLAEQSGLRIEAERYYFQWICPLKLAARAVENVFRLKPRVPRIPPRWINQPLYLLCRIERKTLGALPVPFGNSLMVVGGKPRA